MSNPATMSPTAPGLENLLCLLYSLINNYKLLTTSSLISRIYNMVSYYLAQDFPREGSKL